MKDLKGSNISSRALWLGASTAVISMMLAMPAQAADKSDATSNGAADAAQNTAVAQADQPASSPASNTIVITGRRAALKAATERKRRRKELGIVAGGSFA